LWIARIPWPLFDIVPPRGGAQNRKLPPKFQGLRRTPRRCWSSVSHFRRIQGLWHAVHLGRWLSILDQSIPNGRRLPIYGTGSEGFCTSVRKANRVSGRLRRIGDRTGTCPWNPGPACQRMRLGLHVNPAVLIELSGAACFFLAVPRRGARPSGFGTLLCGIRSREPN